MNKLTIKTTFNNGVEVYQDIKTKQFDVTKLFQTANQNLGINKRVDKWLDSKSCKELFNVRVEKALNELLLQQPLNQENSAKLLKDRNFLKQEEPENEEVMKKLRKEAEKQVLKITKSKNTKEGWVKGSVMADPVMTLDAASYLDARLKNEVYEYYLDDKIKERTKVLEDYKKLCSAIVKYIGKDKTIFQNVVYKINGIVFDKFMGDLWNDGCTKEQYEELDKIFNNLISYMEDGIIDGLQSLLKTLDKWYIKKYGNNF